LCFTFPFTARFVPLELFSVLLSPSLLSTLLLFIEY
jgi:hypothetical protein